MTVKQSYFLLYSMITMHEFPRPPYGNSTQDADFLPPDCMGMRHKPLFLPFFSLAMLNEATEALLADSTLGTLMLLQPLNF